MAVLESAIDVAGMPPQIELVRQIAARRHLQILCTGRAGEAQVIRLSLPDSNPEATASIQTELESVVNMTWAVHQQQASSKTCDRDSPELEVAGPPFGDPALAPAAQGLIWGPPEYLRPLLSIAISCGFKQAHIRSFNSTDRALLTHAPHPPEIGPDWQTLDAGDDSSNRYAPLMCYITLSYRLIADKRFPNGS